MNAFKILINAHDKLWMDKTIPLSVRIDNCIHLWNAAIYVATQAKQNGDEKMSKQEKPSQLLRGFLFPSYGTVAAY
jgi:hypothetical protein